MPPIINSEETKVHLETRRLFIDVTGTGERIVQRTLNILVTSLLENLPGVTVRAVSIDGASTEDGTAARRPTLCHPRPHAAAAEVPRDAPRRV